MHSLILRPQTRCNTRSILNRIIAFLTSLSSFSKSGCNETVKDQNLPYNFFIAWCLYIHNDINDNNCNTTTGGMNDFISF